MARAVLVLPAAALVIAALTALSMPAPAARTPAPEWRPVRAIVRGAFHVHTSRSDGAGSIAEVAAAAASAGLAFVVLTDHGDGTRMPLPPAYHSGVLFIDGVEISTKDGHYATVGMSQSPYPLGGESRDVAEDVRRLGGFGVAAHGDSRKSDSRWRDWQAPIDGLEWSNLDSAWREAAPGTLARGLVSYWLRRPETLASLIGRPDSMLARLDWLAERQPTIALAAADAHGHVLTSYEACFRTMSTRVELNEPLTGRAAEDAPAIVRALAAGHHYTAVDAVAEAPAFEFIGYQDGKAAIEGDTLPAGAPVTFHSRVAAPPGSVSSLLRNGTVVYRTADTSWRFDTDGGSAAYRVEVRTAAALGHPDAPWIVSNPIFVGPRRQPRVASTADAGSAMAQLPVAWQAEQDGTSQVAVERIGPAGVRLRYTLGAGIPTNQYAAAAAPVPPDLSRFQGFRVTARADRPVRVSLQLRADRQPAAPRWQRSIYLDSTARSVSIGFDDMRPVLPIDPPHVPLPGADTLLLIVDLTNERPSAGAVIDVTEFLFEQAGR
jgi:hypothetical protein